MAVEKTIRDRHEYARLQLEGLKYISPPRSPAEYRKREPAYKDPETGPVLYLGQKVVVRLMQRGEVMGYVLGRVIDWEEEDPQWYSIDTTIYFVGEHSSHPNVDKYVGRVRWSRFSPPNYRSRWHALEIVSFDPDDMPRRVDPVAQAGP